MAYEEVQDLAEATDACVAASASLFNAALSAKALVAAAEYHVASALPRRMTDTMVAAALGVSPEALRAAFARVHGESTYRSLLKMRVRLVDLTLRADPDLGPRAVAQVCGFGYFGRFHQLYRRDTGRSPEMRMERAGADDAALQRARAAVALTVERVFRPATEQSAVALEARAVEVADPRRSLEPES
ncbi:helix-turn-helix domain-containing protein [Caulobacter soli]|uniref:helix-turn-helix domain-containing protein n=1 Tax=Caulobacter soli TaxID=2708539 RepID=UPI0013EAA8E8|nr:helix-turn-helix domain-containing protein [Caulobacter soli]